MYCDLCLYDFLYTDDVLGMLLNIEEDKVVFYLNGEAIERHFPAKDRYSTFT